MVTNHTPVIIQTVGKILIILLYYFLIFITTNSNAETNNSKYYSEDAGILSLMYHRFDENKYPSTNIQMDIFKNHIEIIKTNNFKFYNPIKFKQEFSIPKSKKKINKI